MYSAYINWAYGEPVCMPDERPRFWGLSAAQENVQAGWYGMLDGHCGNENDMKW